MHVTRILSCLFGSALLAQAAPVIGINAFSTNPNTFDASSAKGQFKLAPQIGLRIFTTKNIGVDLSLGGALNDQIPADSSTKTAGDPGARVFNAELGLFVKLAEYEGAYIGLNSDLGISTQRWADFDNKARPVPVDPGFATYNVVIPYVFLGVEPGYFFNSHFSLFTRFGINAAYYPASKYIDNTSPSYNPSAHVYPLASRHDDNSAVSISQAGLGIRFLF